MRTRDAIKKIINSNPVRIFINIYPTRINEITGETITNYSGTPTIAYLANPVRISRSQSKVQKLENTDGGPYYYIDLWYMLSDYETPLTEGWTFNYKNRTYRIRTVEELTRDTNPDTTEIIGYQAELQDIKQGTTV